MNRAAVFLLATGAASAWAQAAPKEHGTDAGSLVLAALAVLAFGAGATAMVLITHLALPGVCRRSALLARRTPGRSILYGLLAVVVFGLTLGLANAVRPGLAKPLAVLLGLPFAVFVLIGAAAACHSLGESLLTGAGSPLSDSGVWAVGAGAALLSAANLAPLVGQAVSLVAVLAGLGAALRCFLARASPPPPLEEPRSPQ